MATRAGYYASTDNEKVFLISGDKYFDMIAPISDAENISTLQRTAKKENRIQYLVKLVGYINLLYNMKQNGGGKNEKIVHCLFCHSGAYAAWTLRMLGKSGS